jgi:DCN1-like protein 1/2
LHQKKKKKKTDEHADALLAEGIARLCDDLGVDPSDPVMLALSWRIGAATMCEWSREEFVAGVRALGCASGAPALKAALPGLRREMADPAKFAQMYAYAFGWAADKGQKCLQLDTALAMWRLLLGEGTPRPGGAWPLLERWLAFLKKAHAGRAVGRDTWLQLLEFVRTVRPDMADYDENGAWPYLLDEFVEACRKEGVAAAPDGGANNG